MRKELALALLVLLLIPATHAIEDYTQLDYDDTTLLQQDIQTNTAISQIIAGMSRVEAKQTQLDAKINDTLKKSDLAQFETAVDEKFDRKIGQILARMIVVLLFFTAFFFAALFLMIANGWLIFNKPLKTRKPEKIPIKTTENKKNPGILAKTNKNEEKTMGLEEAIKQINEEEIFEEEPKPTEPEEEFNEDEAAEHISNNYKEFG